MGKKLFVGNCSYGLDESGLESFINEQGVAVTSVNIIRDRETGRSRGFGFVELSDDSDVDRAIETLNGKECDGRALTVNEARDKGASQGRSRGPRNRY